MENAFGALAAWTLSIWAWIAGRVMYVLLRIYYRREPRAILILASWIAALALLIWWLFRAR